jgi:hypothetical protein
VTDILLSTTTAMGRIGHTESITIPIKVERENFDTAFPKSRQPKLAYVHVANDDRYQFPLLGLTRADKIGTITAVIMAAAASAAAVLGWIIVGGI